MENQILPFRFYTFRCKVEFAVYTVEVLVIHIVLFLRFRTPVVTFVQTAEEIISRVIFPNVDYIGTKRVSGTCTKHVI